MNEQDFTISLIPDNIFAKMQEKSYKDNCIVSRDDLCYKLFVEYGFEWGGDWEHAKDYQHFEMPDEWLRQVTT